MQTSICLAYNMFFPLLYHQSSIKFGDECMDIRTGIQNQTKVLSNSNTLFTWCPTLAKGKPGRILPRLLNYSCYCLRHREFSQNLPVSLVKSNIRISKLDCFCMIDTHRLIFWCHVLSIGKSIIHFVGSMQRLG